MMNNEGKTGDLHSDSYPHLHHAKSLCHYLTFKKCNILYGQRLVRLRNFLTGFVANSNRSTLILLPTPLNHVK